MLVVVLGLYLLIIVLLNIPVFQQKMTSVITSELKKILGTELSIGKVDIGLLNRIIIEDVLIDDQSGEEMIKVTRLAAKFDILPLLNGRISISNLQLFGFNINLNRDNPEADVNFKFLIDAFASKDSIKEETNLDLRLNSVLIRRGRLSYDVLSAPDTPEKFNPNHIKLHNIIANISLKALNNDSINGYIKRLSFDEQSGFELNKLSLRVLANQENLKLENFTLNMPNTSINLDTIQLKYNGFKAFEHVTDSVHFKGKMRPSYVSLKDISAFVPALANFQDKFDIDMEFDGTIDKLNCPRLEIRAGNNMQLRGEVSFQDLSKGSDAYVFGNLSRLHISSSGVDFLMKNLTENYSSTPPALKQLGDVSFHGEVSGYFNDLVTYGVFNTQLGVVNADVMLSMDREKESVSYSGSLKTGKFDLGQLTQRDNLGEISFNLNLAATKYTNRQLRAKLKGLISSIEYNNYNYQNIELDGEYENGGFDGKIALNDKNGSVLLNGSFNAIAETPEFNFLAELSHINLNNLNLTPNYKDSEFSLKLHANFRGNSIDNMIGEIDVDSIMFISPEKYYFLDNINVKAVRINTDNELTITSDFLKAEVRGNYSYRSIPASIIKTVERYIPSLLTLNRELKEPENNFSFDINIYNTNILSEVFNIPLIIYTHSTIKGYFNDVARKLRIEGYFPSFSYGGNLFESGMILCENPSNEFQSQLRVSNRKENSVLNLSVYAKAENDELKTSINWGNNAKVTHSGRIAAITNFFKIEGNKPILQANIDIEPTEIILNDSIWDIHPSHIAVDSGRIYIDNFLINHQDQFLRINGKLTKEPEDTVKVELNDINIGYIFDLARINNSVDFTGMASGNLYMNQALKSPEINTTLSVKALTLNDGLLGDAEIFGKWDKEKNGIFLDADIESDVGNTNVEGYVFIKDKGLDLRIDGNGTNIKFIEFYMNGIASNLEGNVYGKIRLFGGFKSLNLEGSALTDASFKINVLNTSYALTDSIHLSPAGLEFKNVRIHDTENHRGTVNGYVRFKHFKDINYRLQINADNMLVFNTKEDPEMPFYGTVYGTGSVLINGSPGRLNVDANVTTNKNTNFVYLLNSTESAASNQFITFVDKTPRRNGYDYNNNLPQEPEDTPIDIRMNLQVDATPDGVMRIIMDPVAGDYISGKGSGNIRVDFYNKGDVKMFGNYTIDQGIYKFSLQEVIRKDFTITSGSTINFNGDPMNANLDIQAIYTVNSASLSDLGFESSELAQNNVRVNCIMNLTGNLTDPTLKFDLDFPNMREDERQIVKSVISTEEQMNMQIIYLLGIGKFYTYDYANNANHSSNAMNSVISSTLSGQLNNMLSHIINSNNWNFGTSLSTGDKGWTDMEIEGILSGQLLNNRLLINGNFGYRDNPMSTTNFVGDFEIEYLLTKSGDIRLKAYNQTNDNRFYSKQALTTQGVGIVYKKDFNTWRDIIFFGRKRKEDSENAADTIKNDSIIIPEAQRKRER